MTPTPRGPYGPRLESRGPVCNERRADLRDAVGEGELELGNQQLLDVGTANVVGLLDLDDAENLDVSIVSTHQLQRERDNMNVHG